MATQRPVRPHAGSAGKAPDLHSGNRRRSAPSVPQCRPDVGGLMTAPLSLAPATCRFVAARPRWHAMQNTVLRVEHLRTEFRIGGAWHAAVDDVSFALAPRETLALVGEVRLRQVGDRAVGDGPGAHAAGTDRRRAHRAGGARTGRPARARDGEAARRADGDDLPGADDQPESGDDDRRAGGRGADGAPGPVAAATRRRRRWRCWTR